MYRYEEIAGHVAAVVSEGALRPGDKVPSVRTLARQFEVSTNTVLKAFSVLEMRGVVVTRPQSGHYVAPATPGVLALNEPVRTRVPSATVPEDRLVTFYRSMRASASVPLGAALVSDELLPIAQVARSLGRVARATRTHAYDPLPGHPLLRRLVAKRLATIGCRVNRDDVLVTGGAIEALQLALRGVAKPGDTVIVESPCYFGISQLLHRLGLRALPIEVSPKKGLPLDSVARALRTRRVAALVCVPSFHNPTGALMPAATRQALVELCSAAEVPIVESDVYGDLSFDGVRPLPLLAFDRQGWVFHCSSLSKSLGASLRVGWLVAPARYRAALERDKFVSTVANPSITQAAAAEFLAQGGFERHLRRLRSALQTSVACARAAIGRAFPPGTRVSCPTGGFLLWVELPNRKAVTGVELARRALTRGISVAPGDLFSVRRDDSTQRRAIRLSLGVRWSPAIERAIDTLGALALA